MATPHVVGILILNGQVAAEALCLRVEPRLLDLDMHQLLLAVVSEHRGGKVDTQDGYVGPLVVDILVGTHLYTGDIPLQ